MSLQSAFSAYLDAPGPVRLAELHREITSSHNFLRATVWLERATELADASRHDELIRLLTRLMPGVLLSPTAHAMLSVAYGGIGEREESQRHRFYAEVSLEAIAGSGDGTEERPWRVLHVADEYALLSSLGLAPAGQRSVEMSGRLIDEITVSDGTQRWFELV